MGDVIADVDDESQVLVRVQDADEPTKACSIVLYREIVGDGQGPAEIDESGPLSAPADEPIEWRTTIDHVAGRHECFFVRVHQENTRDEAWTAPIWIDPSLAPDESEHDTPDPADDVAFVASKKSEVYHYPACKYAKRIAPGNLVKYGSAPDDKRLHQGCPVEE